MRFACLLLLFLTPLFAAKKSLEIYFIDVAGGQATLVVSPSGESMLIDTGWPGFGYRDADRIVAACKVAKVKKIDYVFITHFHTDHVGGARQIAEKIPVGTFIDKGNNVETSKTAREMMDIYNKALEKGQRLIVKVGDKLPIKGLDVQVVSANGNLISGLSGAGQPNPACAGVTKKGDDPTENAASMGLFLTYGSFKFVDLADLTWNKELELVCPNNRLGTVDVFLTSHHGLDSSNPPPLLAALQPKVAIMNNGARKGGSPAAWRVIKASPGLKDFWQLHFSIAGGKENNQPDPFIANTEEAKDGHWLRLTAQSDGTFTVYNSRNKYSRSY
jgi:beta-lactamase superfamily II metal-dependent hydrolase